MKKYIFNNNINIYIILSSAIIFYLYMCCWHWENARGADAWEHHRAVVALSRQMWRPGNPTYATPEPSVRYSPYSLGLAALARWSGADPYDLMCGAAVINTVMLVVGLYALLRVYRQQAAAAAVLVVVVALWGGSPGYANSLALADLPWHQMNPSAFALGLVLLLWTMVRGIEGGRGALLSWPLLGIMGAVAMLSHPMTGAFGFGGLLILALVAPAERRGRLLWAFGVITAFAAGLSLAWPWFDFLEAILDVRDRDYWFNPYILQTMLLQWCAGPAAHRGGLAISPRGIDPVLSGWGGGLLWPGPGIVCRPFADARAFAHAGDALLADPHRYRRPSHGALPPDDLAGSAAGVVEGRIGRRTGDGVHHRVVSTLLPAAAALEHPAQPGAGAAVHRPPDTSTGKDSLPQGRV